MAWLNWNQDYVVGNESIDSDHRQLFELINSFHHEYIQNRDRAKIRRLLNELVRYCEDHFRREEQLMAEAAYPGLDAHCQIHAKLFETIFDLQAQLENDSFKMDRETIGFLRHWLTDHVVEHDVAFARFLSKAAAGKAP